MLGPNGNSKENTGLVNSPALDQVGSRKAHLTQADWKAALFHSAIATRLFTRQAIFEPDVRKARLAPGRQSARSPGAAPDGVATRFRPGDGRRASERRVRQAISGRRPCGSASVQRSVSPRLLQQDLVQHLRRTRLV